MNEINKHKRVWRTAALLLLVLATFGPWAFDMIHVPVSYGCSPPNQRLEGGFCGVPLAGVWILAFIVGGFILSAIGLVMETLTFADVADAARALRALPFFFLLFPLVLPYLTIIPLILRKERQRPMFHMVTWGLAAAAACLFLGLSSFSRAHWALWGILLYIGLAVSMLVLELVALVASRKPGQASLG
jgi:hypothetical protein